MGQTLRWGILGTGNIARQFSRDLVTSRRGRATVAGSRKLETAKAFADAHQIPAAVGSYEELVCHPDVDAVYVSLPNSLHHPWTVAALRAGKHVLCEKPIAATLAEAEEMFDVAARCGRVLVEAFMYRSHPQTLAVVDAIRQGKIGKVRSIRTSFCYRTDRVENNIRFKPELNGGAMMDIGCYCVNFTRLIAGEEPCEISASAEFHAVGVDEMTAGVMRFASGILSTFICGMRLQADNAATIAGSEGYIEIPVPWKPTPTSPWHIGYSAVPLMDKVQGLSNGVIPPKQTFHSQPTGALYAMEADDFAAAVLDGASPRMSPADSLGTLRTVLQIRSISAGRK